jgi:hypothetical protein
VGTARAELGADTQAVAGAYDATSGTDALAEPDRCRGHAETEAEHGQPGRNIESMCVAGPAR